MIIDHRPFFLKYSFCKICTIFVKLGDEKLMHRQSKLSGLFHLFIFFKFIDEHIKQWKYSTQLIFNRAMLTQQDL